MNVLYFLILRIKRNSKYGNTYHILIKCAEQFPYKLNIELKLLSNQIKHYYIPKEKVITVINKEVKYKNTCM